MTSLEPSSPDQSHHQSSPKALMISRSSIRSSKPVSFLSDVLVFACGAFVALLLFWALSSFFDPYSTTNPTSIVSNIHPSSVSFATTSQRSDVNPGEANDPPARTFYDDPGLTYSIERPITEWDAKRREWLRLHPEFDDGRERVFMVTGSQAGPCHNPVGDHLLLRFFKNKADYCRRHGIELYYNTALFHPAMHTYWSKTPTVRAAMLAHPEAEWIWWIDSDAAFTDMDFELPLSRYRHHNMVVHGWQHLVFGAKSWVGLNAGVFLIRNCQWSLDFMAAWGAMGPQTPDYDRWGQVLRSEFKDKAFPESDDQTGLAYLLVKDDKWADKIFLEDSYYFEGYWVEIVGRLNNITKKYIAVESKVEKLRRRHAEKVAGAYGKVREEAVVREGARTGLKGWQRPFITHFTGCQPCSGDHNKIYSGENCYKSMQSALNFADDQVLRDYGFHHANPLSADVRPLPFDYPAAV